MTIKLTKRQQQVVEKAKTTPIVEHLNSDGHTTYSFSDGGGVRCDVVRKLIHQGLIKPSGDGLFPGFSQTWLA